MLHNIFLAKKSFMILHFCVSLDTVLSL